MRKFFIFLLLLASILYVDAGGRRSPFKAYKARERIKEDEGRDQGENEAFEGEEEEDGTSKYVRRTQLDRESFWPGALTVLIIIEGESLDSAVHLDANLNALISSHQKESSLSSSRLEILVLPLINHNDLNRKYYLLDSLEKKITSFHDGTHVITSFVHLQDNIEESGEFSFAEEINDAFKEHSHGEYLMLLDYKTHLSSDYFTSLFRDLNAWRTKMGDPNQEFITSGKILSGDGSIYYAGIDFGMGGIDKDDWYAPKLRPLPYFAHQGRNGLDARTNEERETFSATIASTIMTGSLFSRMGGFSSDYSDPEVTLIAFCLEAKLHYDVSARYFPNSTAIYYGKYSDPASSEKEIKVLCTQFGKEVEDSLKADYEVKDFTLVWNMDCGKGAVLGFTTEALGFISALHGRISLKVELNDIDQCTEDMASIGLPRCTLLMLKRLYNGKVEGKTVHVLHADPGRYDGYSIRYSDAAYIIGRSMYETDRIPAHWLSKIKSIPNVVWVPSHFNLDTFSSSGVNVSDVRVVPEPVDTFVYDPALYQNSHSKFKLAPGIKFRFLSVMKWEKRKGWETLLEYFFEEFTEKDEVSLVLRSNMDHDNLDEFHNFVSDYLKRSGRKEEELPHIELLTRPLPYSRLPSLFASVDCVVLATHGEGWGLPLIEGMAMQKPVIATNWSGLTEFMKADNSYLVPISEMVNATEKGHQWAQISPKELRTTMRRVFSNEQERKLVGDKARESVVSRFRHSAVGDIVISQLQHVEHWLQTTPQSKWRKVEEEEVQPISPGASNHGYNSGFRSLEKASLQPGRVRIKLVE